MALYAIYPASAGAFGHATAYDYIVSGGYSYGSQAQWTIGRIGDNADDEFRGGFALHTMWVGTNGASFENGASWVELGVTQGYEGASGLFFYSAQGINWPSVYSQVNLNDLPCACTNAPLPGPGETHLFSVLNSHGDPIYFVGIDNIFYWSWNGHSPPSTNYGIGMETTCNGCSGTYVCPTPVTSPQWEDANFNFYTTDNGAFRVNGLTGVSQSWSSYPTSFINALSTSPTC